MGNEFQCRRLIKSEKQLYVAGRKVKPLPHCVVSLNAVAGKKITNTFKPNVLTHWTSQSKDKAGKRKTKQRKCMSTMQERKKERLQCFIFLSCIIFLLFALLFCIFFFFFVFWVFSFLSCFHFLLFFLFFFSLLFFFFPF